jgi:hypothetical protein
MTQYIRRFAAPLALAAALVAGACQGDKQDTLAEDTSALGRDLALAGADSAAQPQLTDTLAAPPPEPAPTTPAATRPTTSRPSGTTSRPRTPTTRTTPSGNTETRNPTGSTGSSGEAGGGAVGVIAAGTSITGHSGARICTNTHKVGDTFTANVAEAVSGSNGAVIPAGADLILRITELKRSENVNDPVRVGLAVEGVRFEGKTYPLDAQVTYANIDKVRNQPKSKDAQKVIGGAIIGAVIGQAAGKNTKGTVIGAAAGAAAGAGAAAATANYEGCIGETGRIVVQLNSAAQIRA